MPAGFCEALIACCGAGFVGGKCSDLLLFCTHEQPQRQSLKERQLCWSLMITDIWQQDQLKNITLPSQCLPAHMTYKVSRLRMKDRPVPFLYQFVKDQWKRF